MAKGRAEKKEGGRIRIEESEWDGSAGREKAGESSGASGKTAARSESAPQSFVGWQARSGGQRCDRRSVQCPFKTARREDEFYFYFSIVRTPRRFFN